MKEEIETLEEIDDRKNISVITSVIYTLLNALFPGIMYLMISIILIFIIKIFDTNNILVNGYTNEVLISLVFLITLKTGINRTFKNRKLKKENNSSFLKSIIIIIIVFNVLLSIFNCWTYQINMNLTESNAFDTLCVCRYGDKDCDCPRYEKAELKENTKKDLIYKEILIIISFSIEVAFVTDDSKKRIN